LLSLIYFQILPLSIWYHPSTCATVLLFVAFACTSLLSALGSKAQRCHVASNSFSCWSRIGISIFNSQISAIVCLIFHSIFFLVQFESATSGSIEASGTDDEDSSTQFSEISFDDWKESITSNLPSWLESVSVFCSSSYLEVQERVRPFVFFVHVWELLIDIFFLPGRVTFSSDEVVVLCNQFQHWKRRFWSSITLSRTCIRNFFIFFRSTQSSTSQGSIQSTSFKLSTFPDSSGFQGSFLCIRQVPVPKGLDLESWIHEPEPEPVVVNSITGFEFLFVFWSV
jgi:hypothetical protein